MSNEITITYEKSRNIIDRTGVYSVGEMLNRYSPQRKYDDPGARVEPMNFDVSREELPALISYTAKELNQYGGNDYHLINFLAVLIDAWTDQVDINIEVSGD